MAGKKQKELPERFWAKVQRGRPDDCWVWVASLDSKGYGQMKCHGRPTRAHRISWSLHNGPIPPGCDIMHKCDNPPCVNPRHLILGNHKANMADAARKKRLRTPVLSGEAHPRSRLTEDQVRRIRLLAATGWRQVDIAERLGIHQTTVSQVVNGKTWRHVA